MEDYYLTSQNYSFSYFYVYSDPFEYDFNDSHDQSNITINSPISKLEGALSVWTWIVISLGLPLTLMAIYSLLSLVRNDHVAPICVINLLISDIIQFCYMIVEMVAPLQDRMIYRVFYFIYYPSLLASVVFMVCIALERYLLIVHAVWYRCRRTIKTSVVVCVLVWVLTATLQIFSKYFYNIYFKIIYNVFFLLPFPLLIFFLGATLKALSASISVPSDDKRRVVGMLVLVLLIYTLLFLPHIISVNINRPNSHFPVLSKMFLRLSPLADLLLYIFLRKGTVKNLCSSSACCRRIQGNDISSSVIAITTRPQSAS